MQTNNRVEVSVHIKCQVRETLQVVHLVLQSQKLHRNKPLEEGLEIH